MASYPKRLDLWNVYLDKEVKGGDIRAARNLLERLVSVLMCTDPFFSRSLTVVYSQALDLHASMPGDVLPDNPAEVQAPCLCSTADVAVLQDYRICCWLAVGFCTEHCYLFLCLVKACPGLHELFSECPRFEVFV